MIGLLEHPRGGVGLSIFLLLGLFMAVPTSMHGQSQTSCTSGAVHYQDRQTDVEETVCLYYDGLVGLDASVSTDNDSYETFEPSVDQQNGDGYFVANILYIYGVAAQAQIWGRGATYDLLADPGMNYGDITSDGGREADAEAGAIATNQYNTYALNSFYDECVGGSSDDCWWVGGAAGEQGLSVQLQGISPKMQPTISLGSSGTPTVAGQPVTFTAVTSGAGATTTGSVTFYDGGTEIGQVSNNSAYAVNLVPDSSNFANWNSNTAGVWPNATGGPYPSSEASLLFAGPGKYYVGQWGFPCSPGPVTHSVWLMQYSGVPAISVLLSVRFIDSQGAELVFTGSYFAPPSSWQRVSETYTAPPGTTSCWIGIEQVDSMGRPATSGGVYAWGAQVEQASTAGPYIATGSPPQISTGGRSFILTTSALAPGVHTITAGYSGDANYAPVTSYPITQLVNLLPGQQTANYLYGYAIASPGGTSGYSANGNIISYADLVNGTWSLGYDGLNRLTSGSASRGYFAGVQANWGYDSFGNRTSETFGGTSGVPMPTSSTAQYNANNQVSSSSLMSGTGLVYDAAGNVTQDNQNRYLYDGEGRVCASQGLYTGAVTGYIYDAEGNRVAKGTLSGFDCGSSFTETNWYVLGQSNEQLTETDGQGNWLHTNVFAAGALIATYDGQTNNTVFALTDWLGTKRVEVGANGCLTDYTGLPFGNGLTPVPVNGYAPCGDVTEHHYTAKERDTESGLDYFGARYYGSSMGRFMSPDWADHPEAVPYSSLGNPQTLNLYAYVGNNPMTGLDPDGHKYGDGLDCSGKNAAGAGCQDVANYNKEHDINGYGNESQQSSPAQGNSTNTTQGQSKDYASVSYWPKSAGGFGHIGIGVDTDDTQGYSTLDPKVPWYKRLFGAPAGNPEDDLAAHTSPSGEVAPHSYLHIPITAEQAQAMRAVMAARTADPGHYNLIFNNCAQFVESVLHGGGVSGVPHAEVFGPAVLGGVLWLGH